MTQPPFPAPHEQAQLLQAINSGEEPVLPIRDEYPNKLRTQLEENRDAIPKIATVQRTFIATVGHDYDIQLGFAAACVIISNPTPYWWYLPDVGMYVPPITMNMAVNYSMRPQAPQVRFFAPPDYAQPAITNAASVATFVFIDKPLNATTVIVPPTGGGGGGGNVVITGPLDGSGNVKIAAETPVTVVQPTGSSLHVDVDSAPTTTVVQPTGSSLHVDVDALPAVAGAVTATPPAETPFHIISAATTNATVVKASAGTIRTLYVFNQNAAIRYLKIFNKATAPIPGTDTPILNIPIPANGAGANFGGGAVIPVNIANAAGIGIAITAGQADLDATAVAAGDVMVNMSYI